jgi:outer membrane scaffolding protein for murein synthesis (MipA/OmpV family)
MLHRLTSASLSIALSGACAVAWADTPSGAAKAPAAAPAVAAAAPAAPAATRSSWGLGLLVSTTLRPYRDVDSRVRVLPALQYENAWVRVFGPMVDLKVPRVGPVELALRAQYMDDGYKASDSAYLAGMNDRKGGVWLGLRADWPTPVARFAAEWMADSSGNSDGQHVKLTVDRMFPVGRFGVAPRLGLLWQDSKYVNHHYGVSAAEALADRPAYEGKAALSTELGVRVLYGLSPAQSVFLDLSSTALGSSIKDSPLVERSRVSGLRAGYLHRF